MASAEYFVKRRNAHQELPQSPRPADVTRVACLRQLLLPIGAGGTASTLVVSDRRKDMSDIKGPAIDPEAFSVEGHCCGIRLPVLKTLTGEGIQWEFTPETKSELVAAGVLPSDDGRDPPKTG